eukprot:SAG31_NODE_308_length_17951_cov_4.779240_1_plen_163_part_00
MQQILRHKKKILRHNLAKFRYRHNYQLCYSAQPRAPFTEHPPPGKPGAVREAAGGGRPGALLAGCSPAVQAKQGTGHTLAGGRTSARRRMPWGPARARSAGPGCGRRGGASPTGSRWETQARRGEAATAGDGGAACAKGLVAAGMIAGGTLAERPACAGGCA